MKTSGVFRPHAFAAVVAALLPCWGVSLPTGAAEPAAAGPPGPRTERGPDADFLNTWLLLGPLDGGGGKGLDTDLIGEAGVRPSAGGRAAGETWEPFDDRLFSRNYDDYQDLYSHFKLVRKMPVANRVAYAHLHVWSPEDRAAELRVGANDALKAWINGELAGRCPGPLAFRDAERLKVQLKAGWNRLLLKIANGGPVQELKDLETLPSGHGSHWTWGFYARLCDSAGAPLGGLVPSLDGPEGELRVATWAMPRGYREWPYVWLRLGKAGGENDVQASRFRFLAGGGKPPYRWSIAGGSLPPGISLDPDRGALDGLCESAGAFPFTIRVEDAQGMKSERQHRMDVVDRPNRWIEEARLGSLLHGTEQAFECNTDATFIRETGRRLKRMGIRYACPKSFRNAGSWVPGLRAAGIERIGLYVSRYGEHAPRPFHNDYFHEQVERLMEQFQPALLWFDEFGFKEAQARCGGHMEFDALFSMIRARNPDTLILNNNGSCDTLNRGDVDLLEAEGWGGDHYYVNWPHPKALDLNPKKMPIESWRFPNAKARDWQEWLRVVFSLVGEGHTASLDGSVYDGSSAPGEAVPFQEAIVKWMEAGKGVHVSEALAGTQPVPLKEAPWGYAVRKGQAVYLYILRNKRGKTGWPAEDAITLKPQEPWNATCAGATLLNSNTPLQFTQQDGGLVLQTKGVVPDPVVSVVKLTMERAK